VKTKRPASSDDDEVVVTRIRRNDLFAQTISDIEVDDNTYENEDGDLYIPGSPLPEQFDDSFNLGDLNPSESDLEGSRSVNPLEDSSADFPSFTRPVNKGVTEQPRSNSILS
jgi:hypothetical protein